MKTKKKGQIEAEISEAVVKYKIKHIGKGPEKVKSYIIEDMVVIRIKEALTILEQELTKTSEGLEIVKHTRLYFAEKAQSVLAKLIRTQLNVDISSFYADVNPAIAEMFIVLSLSKDVEVQFKLSKKSA